MAEEYVASPVDFVAEQVRRYIETDGREAGDLQGVPVVILTTRGAKSAKVRRSPVMRIADGDRYVAIASQGGAPTSPSWYHNLVAEPNVTVQDKGEVMEMTARTAVGDERADLWKKANAVWPDYDTYQANTDREIPVVVLEPRTPTG